MTSQLAWLDYSDSERRKALTVIDLFNEHDTRDELGIGSVRDSFADELFPGTSTIQTRARYFLFIPWIYQQLEKQHLPFHQINDQARGRETRLIEALIKGNAGTGVVGRDARQHIQRLPSSIYWAGLGHWGIRRNIGSLDDYHRDLARGGSRQHVGREEGDLLLTQGGPWWHENLPSPPDDFLKETDFQLTKEEARYLTERIIISTRTHNSLLAYLVTRTTPSLCDFPWHHPQTAQFSAPLKRTLKQAERFSLVMHGASLLYNLLLADAKNGNREEEQPAYYQDKLDLWWQNVLSSNQLLSDWNLDAFWKEIQQAHPEQPGSERRIPWRTEIFCGEWIQQVLGNLQAASWKKLKTNATDLIRKREYQLKRSKARLFKLRALENWIGNAGTQQINYRWPIVQTLVEDILTPQQ
jgi:hypothetical protein